MKWIGWFFFIICLIPSIFYGAIVSAYTITRVGAELYSAIALASAATERNPWEVVESINTESIYFYMGLEQGESFDSVSGNLLERAMHQGFMSR